MLTTHVQRGLAYCFFKDVFVPVPSEHIQNVCVAQACPYLAGSAQGEGVECRWDDGTDDGLTVDMPVEDLRERAQTMQHKG